MLLLVKQFPIKETYTFTYDKGITSILFNLVKHVHVYDTYDHKKVNCDKFC